MSVQSEIPPNVNVTWGAVIVKRPGYYQLWYPDFPHVKRTAADKNLDNLKTLGKEELMNILIKEEVLPSGLGRSVLRKQPMTIVEIVEAIIKSGEKTEHIQGIYFYHLSGWFHKHDA